MGQGDAGYFAHSVCCPECEDCFLRVKKSHTNRAFLRGFLLTIRQTEGETNAILMLRSRKKSYTFP